MVLVPLVSLAYVHESGPTGTTLSASSSALDGAQRIESFHARASRSAARQPLDDRAVPTTSTSTSTTSTSTTAAPATTVKKAVVVTTTAKPRPTTTTTAKPNPTTTTTAKPPATTTTTAKPVTTTTAPAATSGHQEGDASFHDYADARTCAHRTLPFGTVLTVTNLANGKKTTCVVNDRGPYADGRIVDLSRTAFSAIGNTADGVIHVAIDW